MICQKLYEHTRSHSSNTWPYELQVSATHFIHRGLFWPLLVESWIRVMYWVLVVI